MDIDTFTTSNAENLLRLLSKNVDEQQSNRTESVYLKLIDCKQQWSNALDEIYNKCVTVRVSHHPAPSTCTATHYITIIEGMPSIYDQFIEIFKDVRHNWNGSVRLSYKETLATKEL